MTLDKIISSDTKPFLQKAWDQSGFQNPTSVQTKVGSIIMEGKDLLVEAPTGSGKTLAYLVPLLQKIDSDKKKTQIVIMTASHELAMQVHTVVQEWTKGSDINSASFIGGANIKRQLEKLKKHPQVVVGTPGRLLELVKRKKLKMHEVNTIVLDEGDQLLVPEHFQTIKDIVTSALNERQLLLFSATLPKEAETKAQIMMKDPDIIRIDELEVNQPVVDHIYFVGEQREKTDLLRKIIRSSNIHALVFVKDIGSLTVVAEKLEYKGVSLGVLHSDANKQERAKVIKSFREEKLDLLLATDVAARGLDIHDLPYVINLDLPKESNQYIHRAGRTGRLGGSSEGTVISILTEFEEGSLRKFSRKLNIPITRKVLYKGQIIDDKK
ncbi:DEAD/DEAH box helicase [Aquibacillus saliphilus]|uniref:DEAD/DEAH box helicase n=1 Tax=Aquibacillus saliphilus TaxID=1909422 RepID=UPI001CF09194|nr:DEAD/DEAH box helicase [Aquibacillus saliphilus]